MSITLRSQSGLPNSKGSFTLQAEPNRTDSAWETNLHNEMEAFTLHAELNRTERVHWPMFVFTRQPTTDSAAQ